MKHPLRSDSAFEELLRFVHRTHRAKEFWFGDDPDLLVGDLGAAACQMDVRVDQAGHHVVPVEVDLLDASGSVRYADMGTMSTMRLSRTSTA
jgi:hypothetical protein